MGIEKDKPVKVWLATYDSYWWDKYNSEKIIVGVFASAELAKQKLKEIKEADTHNTVRNCLATSFNLIGYE